MTPDQAERLIDAVDKLRLVVAIDFVVVAVVQLATLITVTVLAGRRRG